MTSPVKTLDELKDSWCKIYELAQQRHLPIHLAFLGGEPTANRNFLPLIEWIYLNYQPRIDLCGFSTNGSAPIKIYRRLIQLVDYISFSTHSEYWDEKKFFETVIDVKKCTENTHKRINVSIMDEPWNAHRFDFYKELLTEHKIDWKMGYIEWKYANRTIPIKNQRSTDYVAPTR